jgi:hypothetical protein
MALQRIDEISEDPALFEKIFSASMSECFSDETRKTRNILLTVCSIVAFQAFGYISYEGTTKTPIGISIKFAGELKVIVLVISIFYLVLFATRSYSEWNLWRLKCDKPERELLEISERITQDVLDRTAEYYSAVKDHKKVRQMPVSLTAGERELERISLSISEDKLASADQSRIIAVKRSENLWRFFRPLRNTRILRFWWEAVFPIVFSISALSAAIVRWYA